jgi:hypothetical protein
MGRLVAAKGIKSVARSNVVKGFAVRGGFVVELVVGRLVTITFAYPRAAETVAGDGTLRVIAMLTGKTDDGHNVPFCPLWG